MKVIQLTLRRITVLAAVPLLLLAGCGGGDQDEGAVPTDAAPVNERAVPVEVTIAQVTSFEEVIQMTGTIEAPDDATLSAESAGTLRTLAPLGTVVRRGQVVAQIDAGIARAALGQAEAGLQAAQAQLELAEDQFRRQEPLYRDSIISALEFQAVRTQQAAARAQVAQAQASVAQAREHVGRTRVVAPFNGTVEAHLAERGAQVSPGMPVVRLVSTGVVNVRAGVPERYAGEIGVGTTVLVTPQAYELPPRRAVVAFAGQSVDAQSRTFPIEVRLDNPDGRLKPQMVVRLEVTRRTLSDVLAVPMSAVVRDERGTSVYVVRGESVPTARLQPVVLGPSGGGRIVILEGLEAGDRVITQGQTTVADGDQVRISEQHTSSALSARISTR
jgi:membrane fusion protein, multidrug efflux system